jgi:hypothetical protein
VVITRRQLVIVGLSCFIALGGTIEAHSDTLFKARQPIKIGHGKKESGNIHWTDCSEQNPETFDEPPYSLDLADNCSVRPFTFGLECEGESCRVADETKLQKYMPEAHRGEKVQLHIQQHAVELQSGTKTIHLER